MIILDTSALLAYFRADDPDQQRIAEVLESDPVRVVSPFVIAELDYLLLSRFGLRVESAVLAMLGSGNFDIPHLGPADLVVCRRLIDHYGDHEIGVTDASLVVLADRYRTSRVLTLDRRHFSVLRTLGGHPFELLP